MSEIKNKLKELVKNAVIPQVESYIEEKHLLLQNNTASLEDIEEIKDMESFLVELQNILLVIKEDKINGKKLSNQDAKEVYDKIQDLIK